MNIEQTNRLINWVSAAIVLYSFAALQVSFFLIGGNWRACIAGSFGMMVMTFLAYAIFKDYQEEKARAEKFSMDAHNKRIQIEDLERRMQHFANSFADEEQSIIVQPLRKLTTTHTTAELKISADAWNEISALLRKASYDHVFVAQGVIDMTGIAIVKASQSVMTEKE